LEGAASHFSGTIEDENGHQVVVRIARMPGARRGGASAGSLSGERRAQQDELLDAVAQFDLITTAGRTHQK
jgi:hypothetical protein